MFGSSRFRARHLVTAAICSFMCAASHSQTRINAANLTGIPIVKTVQSMRDIRYSNIVSQQLDYSCGAAALATLLKFGYGINISETELIAQMMQFSPPEVVVKSGFSMLDMKKYVSTIGLHGRGFRINVSALYHLRIPVMVLMNINGYEHFVIVKHAEDQRIFIADPALGNRIVSEDDFVKSWNGLVFAILGKPFAQNSPLLDNNQSIALKLRAQALDNSSGATPFVDYGLSKVTWF